MADLGLDAKSLIKGIVSVLSSVLTSRQQKGGLDETDKALFELMVALQERLEQAENRGSLKPSEPVPK
jgi:hypothetical protein